MKAWRSGAEVLRQRLEAAPAVRVVGSAMAADRSAVTAGAGAEVAAATALPAYVVDRLAQWRLLHDVPFEHLVPDSALLPNESLRFFFIDSHWTDALTEGAMSVGASATQEQALVDAVRDDVQAAVDPAVAGVRDRLRGREVSTGARAETAMSTVVTGLVLRSSAVTYFPGMQVRAYNGLTRLALLRLSQLAPSVLLALFSAPPTLVILEEPHTSVQLGVTAKVGGGFSMALRGSDGAVLTEANQAVRVDVPLRAGSEALGVLDVAALAARVDQAAQSRPAIPRPVGAAVLALQLLRAPWRQRFASAGSQLPPPPEIAGVQPASGRQGQELTVRISGSALGDVVSVSFGAGVEAIVEQAAATFVDARLTIATLAPLGPRTFRVATPNWATNSTATFEVTGASLAARGEV